MWMLRRAMRQVELTEEDLKLDTLDGSLLDRSTSSVSNMLDRFRGDELAFERDIADLTERLRQTRVAITAFEAAGRILGEGKNIPAPADNVGRLVPRTVRGSSREIAEADTVVLDGKIVKSRSGS